VKTMPLIIHNNTLYMTILFSKLRKDLKNDNKCLDCHHIMGAVNSCNKTRCGIIYLKGFFYKRNSNYFDVNKRCHDCGIINKKGNIHHLGCDVEKCPRCKGHLISCGCL
jgi:hypothetical protein